MTEDQAPDTYSEPGRGYGGLLVIGVFLVSGVLLDAALGGLHAHVLGWLVAAVVLLGIDVLVIRAARSQKSLSLTAAELRVGEQSVRRSDVVAVVDTDERPRQVLGWPTGIPRGMDALAVRLRDGHLVAVPTRHPDRLAAALGLRRAHAHDIRPATQADLAELPEIERRAATVFRVAGIAVPDPPIPEHSTARTAAVFVAGTPPVAFARVEQVDGLAHLAQLDVLPDEMRSDLGARLVECVCGWARQQGCPAVTVITFRDVPWDAPFYAHLGFMEIEQLSPGLAAMRQREKEAGWDAAGPRAVMRRDLVPPASN